MVSCEWFPNPGPVAFLRHNCYSYTSVELRRSDPGIAVISQNPFSTQKSYDSVFEKSHLLV
jgi:hypothetical protein